MGKALVKVRNLTEEFKKFKERVVQPDEKLMSFQEDGMELRLYPIEGMKTLYEKLESVAGKHSDAVEEDGRPMPGFVDRKEQKYIRYFDTYQPSIEIQMQFADLRYVSYSTITSHTHLYRLLTTCCIVLNLYTVSRTVLSGSA